MELAPHTTSPRLSSQLRSNESDGGGGRGLGRDFIFNNDEKLQAYLIWWHFAFHAAQTLPFEQIEGKTLHQQKDDISLYCDTCFIVVLWNQTRNFSKACLCTSQGHVCFENQDPLEDEDILQSTAAVSALSEPVPES